MVRVVLGMMVLVLLLLNRLLAEPQLGELVLELGTVEVRRRRGCREKALLLTTLQLYLFVSWWRTDLKIQRST